MALLRGLYHKIRDGYGPLSNYRSAEVINLYRSVCAAREKRKVNLVDTDSGYLLCAASLITINIESLAYYIRCEEIDEMQAIGESIAFSIFLFMRFSPPQSPENLVRIRRAFVAAIVSLVKDQWRIEIDHFIDKADHYFQSYLCYEHNGPANENLKDLDPVMLVHINACENMGFSRGAAVLFSPFIFSGLKHLIQIPQILFEFDEKNRVSAALSRSNLCKP